MGDQSYNIQITERYIDIYHYMYIFHKFNQQLNRVGKIAIVPLISATDTATLIAIVVVAIDFQGNNNSNSGYQF